MRTGTAGPDVMPGSARREFFEAGAGNDRIAASGGDDIVAAGAGVDTMVLSSVRSDYTLSARAAERMMTVSDRQPGRDGTVNLEQVEVLQFADRKLAIDLTADGGAGQVALTLGVLYPQGLREPAIVGALLGLADAGLDAAAICQRLADAGILAALAGSNQPAEIARMAVRNVLKIVEPDAALVSTLAAYMDGRAANYTPAQFLGIVAGLELNQAAVGLVGLQQTGLEFI